MEYVKSQLRPIPAKEHPLVDRWLRLMAGPQYPLLATWIANVPNLATADDVLLLCGPLGTGKTLLARGLARLWDDHPTDFRHAASVFNWPIRHCPLIVGDGVDFSDASNLRVLERARQTAHTFHWGYDTPKKLDNALRLILTINGCFEIPNVADLRRIDTRAAGAEYLAERRAQLEPLIEKNWIAEHALFLREKGTGK